MEIFGVSHVAVLSQLSVGLVNGSFYALLSMGLAIIFGLLGIVNFAHGALYMLGAMTAWLLFTYLGVGYWQGLLLSPLIVALLGVAVERTLIRRIYDIDHVYGMLLTFGIALVASSGMRYFFGTSGQVFPVPDLLSGAVDLGFMQMPKYRIWVIFASLTICVATWLLVERTRLGSNLRAATENPELTQGLGINVPMLVSLSYAFGVALAAFGGVLAAPIYLASPMMGDRILITTFAVVVIGGFGSIAGAIVTGIGLGVIEAMTRVYLPAAGSIVVFLVMLGILAIRPAGLFGSED